MKYLFFWSVKNILHEMRTRKKLKVVMSSALMILICIILIYHVLLHGNAMVRTNTYEISMPDVFINADFADFQEKNETITVTGYCQLNWTNFGKQEIDLEENVKIQKVIAENLEVNKGGAWSPSDCYSFQRVAIIVPYWKRWFHLQILLKYLHPMLRKQKIDYRIFLIEQVGSTIFNKALIMNAGFIESMNYGYFDCFIFHDVDLIPEHDGNIYLCNDHLRHFTPAIDEMNYEPLYLTLAGGVIGLSRQNFVKINGFSNSYWGWGAEDDDIYSRSEAAGLKLVRPPLDIGRYKMIKHKKRKRSKTAYKNLDNWHRRWNKDGLNSLSSSKYRVVSSREQRLYTNITVDVGQVPSF